MANCRCADIAECQEKINTLNDAKLNYWSKISRKRGTGWDDSVYFSLESMKNNIGKTTDSEVVETALSGMTSQHSALTDARDNIFSKINKKLEDLYADKSNMSAEDTTYHEEQARISEAAKEKESATA